MHPSSSLPRALGALCLIAGLTAGAAAHAQTAAAPAAAAASAPSTAPVDPAKWGFFVTSEGHGQGANLGGLSGADAHCQKLATAAGAGQKTWHAYLSTQASDGKP
jgi:hypothetical protein